MGGNETYMAMEMAERALYKYVHEGKPLHVHDMYFYASKNSTLLFKSWKIESETEFWIAIGGIVVIGLLYEMVKSFRSCLIIEAQRDALNAENKPILGDHSRSWMEECCIHGVLTLIYILETLIHFILMLIFMSFNVWFCFAVIFGMGIGYFSFGSS